MSEPQGMLDNHGTETGGLFRVLCSDGLSLFLFSGVSDTMSQMLYLINKDKTYCLQVTEFTETKNKVM